MNNMENYNLSDSVKHRYKAVVVKRNMLISFGFLCFSKMDC